MTAFHLLRKQLREPLQAPVWPSGIRLQPLSAIRPRAIHDLLVAAYADGGGTVAAFEPWWTGLVEDSEFDPDLVFIAADAEGQLVALAQCWTGAFIKDLVVAPSHRGRGFGEALLRTVFSAFKERGASHVDLKVLTDNAVARRLYARVGMIEVEV
jgi:ribosomal protein S18 acetylase RimI-like enzyme